MKITVETSPHTYTEKELRRATWGACFVALILLGIVFFDAHTHTIQSSFDTLGLPLAGKLVRAFLIFAVPAIPALYTYRWKHRKHDCLPGE